MTHELVLVKATTPGVCKTHHLLVDFPTTAPDILLWPIFERGISERGAKLALRMVEMRELRK